MGFSTLPLTPLLSIGVFPPYIFLSAAPGSLSSVLSVDSEKDREGTEEGRGSRTRLIAQNIPWSYSCDDVRRFFQKHGVVDDVELSMHNSTRNRGLAFVTMDSEEDAGNALSNLNSEVLDGRVIKVEYSTSTKKKPSPEIKIKPKNEIHSVRRKHDSESEITRSP